MIAAGRDDFETLKTTSHDGGTPPLDSSPSVTTAEAPRSRALRVRPSEIAADQTGIPPILSTIPAYLNLVMEKGRDLVVNAGNSFSCKV